MLTMLVMSDYLELSFFKWYQALFENARSASTSPKNMVTQTIFHNFKNCVSAFGSYFSKDHLTRVEQNAKKTIIFIVIGEN